MEGKDWKCLPVKIYSLIKVKYIYAPSWGGCCGLINLFPKETHAVEERKHKHRKFIILAKIIKTFYCYFITKLLKNN